MHPHIVYLRVYADAYRSEYRENPYMNIWDLKRGPGRTWRSFDRRKTLQKSVFFTGVAETNKRDAFILRLYYL